MLRVGVTINYEDVYWELIPEASRTFNISGEQLEEVLERKVFPTDQIRIELRFVKEEGE